ncbi:hypothetical protein [Halorubrum sp. N11]
MGEDNQEKKGKRLRKNSKSGGNNPKDAPATMAKGEKPSTTSSDE